MAGYSTNDNTLLNDAADLRRMMKFAGSYDAMRGGIEIEFHFQDMRKASTDEPSLASDDRVLELKRTLKNRKISMVDEMGGQMGEICTDAYPATELRHLMQEIRRTRSRIIEQALAMDLKPSPYAVLADYNRAAFNANMIRPVAGQPDRGARQRCMIGAWAAHLSPQACDWPVQNTAIHVNHGAKDLEHHYSCYRRNVFLMPVLLMLMENRPPFIAGEKQNAHLGLLARQALGERGLVPDIFFESRGAEDFISRFYTRILNRPMYAWLEGETYRSADAGRQTPPSFEDLKARGLNTTSNALQALSMDWPFQKLAKIRSSSGEILGERLETRDIDPGNHQPFTAALAVLLPAMSAECGAEIDALLASYGFDVENPGQSRDAFKEAVAAATHRGDRFLDIPYGVSSMAAFAKDYGHILQRHARIAGVEDYLAPLVHICETGRTDAKVLAERLKTYEDVLNFQKHYDPGIFRDPKLCLAQLDDRNMLFGNTQPRPQNGYGLRHQRP